MSKQIAVPKELLDHLAKDPRYLEKLVKRASQREFKERYSVTQASGLRCPKCSQYGLGGGSLWWDPSLSKHFVCRKCLLEFEIKCLTRPIEKVIEEVKSGRSPGLDRKSNEENE